MGLSSWRHIDARILKRNQHHAADDSGMSSNTKQGALVISLDFELYWGVRDVRGMRIIEKLS